MNPKIKILGNGELTKKFGSPRDAGCYFGLTAGQDQSGDIDKPKNFTKGGNEMMRKILVTSANYILRQAMKNGIIGA